MKILAGIDLPFLPSCGSLIFCHDLYRYLPPGIKVRFLALKSHDSNWSEISDVKLIEIRKETDGRRYKSYISKLREEVEKNIRQFKPDVIHIHHLTFGMSLAFVSSALPQIAFCHGTDVLYALKNNFHRKNIRQICDSARTVVFPTKAMYADFLKVYPGYKRRNIIPWGLPKPFIGSKAEKICHPQPHLKLLFAGRVAENKSAETIIKALDVLPEKVKFAIIGSGDKLRVTNSLIEKYHLQKRVDLISFMPREQLWETFRNFDALVVPTKKIEAFCLVALEAQAHGLPVIYAKTGGLNEIIGASGLGFRPGDHHDLAAKISRLIEKPKLLENYARKGGKNSEKYPLETSSKLIFALSKKVINGSRLD